MSTDTGIVIKHIGTICGSSFDFIVSIPGDKPFILLASRVEIRKVIPSNAEHQSSQHNLLVHGLQNVASIDVHVEYELLFWVDVTLGHIKAIHLNSSSTTEFNEIEVISVGLDTPGNSL